MPFITPGLPEETLVRRSYLRAITHCWAGSGRVTHGITDAKANATFSRELMFTNKKVTLKYLYRLRKDSDDLENSQLGKASKENDIFYFRIAIKNVA